MGEVERLLGIKPHVLRYWEQQFPMLAPLKRSGGRRYYRTDDIALLKRIDRMVNQEGYTIKGARAALSQAGAAEAAHDSLSRQELATRLRRIADRLRQALD
ncbi:MerR family transcriptional regulator [Porphyrobacter sp. GA68]|uniref:MerR family transcriptional regulator n=1 Tax=Porphyrobacter sp. GA68 TaxID=2883480 RepID=UPI003592F7D2